MNERLGVRLSVMVQKDDVNKFWENKILQLSYVMSWYWGLKIDSLWIVEGSIGKLP